MVREGLFDDVDAAVTWHPEAFAGMFNVSTLANIQAAWRFHGVAATPPTRRIWGAARWMP
jgi:aminobenzoyl-glutamate utilization protein B